MFKIFEIDLGSAVLSIFILAGFIASAIAFVKLAIIGVNYIKVNFSKEEVEIKGNPASKSESKGF